jgi:hypothetical protein
MNGWRYLRHELWFLTATNLLDNTHGNIDGLQSQVNIIKAVVKGGF